MMGPAGSPAASTASIPTGFECAAPLSHLLPSDSQSVLFSSECRAHGPGGLSLNSWTMDVKSVNYVAVVRRGDNVILGQRVHIPTAVDYVEYTRKVIGSAGWASVETDKLTLSDGENCFFVLIDPSGIAFIAIASKHYPARYVYDSADGSVAGLLGELCRQFMASFGRDAVSCPPDAYTNRAKNLFRDLCTQYNDLKSIDKVTKVQEQLREVAGVMRENIDKISERGERLDTLFDKSQRLSEQAGKFESSATTLKKRMRCQNWKLTAMISAVVLIVLAIIIAILAVKLK